MKRGISSASFRRSAAIIVGAVLVSVLVVAAGVTSAARSGNPELALLFSPFDSRALEARADQLIQGGADEQTLARVRSLALGAIARDPTSVGAVRTLATVELAQGRSDRADDLINYAARLSRRDIPTTLYLIDQRVAQGDIPGALQFFDIALRTSLESRDTLYPILYEALADDQLVDPMTRFFRKDQSWLPSFLDAALGKASSAVNLSKVIAGIPSTKAGKDPHLRQVVLNRLVRDSEFAAARDYLFALEPQERARGAGYLRDSDFTRDLNLPPFDWVLEASSNVGAYRVASDDRRARGLGFYARGGQNGVVASQLLLLPPGEYGFQSFVGRTGRARWVLRCAAGQSSELLSVSFVTGQLGVSKSFSVPADQTCQAQWLRLEIIGNDEGGEFEGLVNSVSINPKSADRQ